jgi:toxin FitB
VTLNYLLDTNIISELRKGTRCDAGVRKWFDSVDQAQLFTSVLVIGEIRKGIENIRRRDPQSANHLDLWLTDMLDAFPKRIIDIDRKIAITKN